MIYLNYCSAGILQFGCIKVLKSKKLNSYLEKVIPNLSIIKDWDESTSFDEYARKVFAIMPEKVSLQFGAVPLVPEDVADNEMY